MQVKKILNSIVKDINESERTLTAMVSTDGIDRMDEVLDPKGADLRNYRRNPVVLWAHDYNTPPIGKALWIKKSGNGLLSKVQFANTEFGKEIFELYKGGFLSAFSVGFIPKKVDTPELDGDKSSKGKRKPRRIFKEWEVLEYSAVPVPANPEALSLAMQKGILKSDSLIDAISNQYGMEEKVLGNDILDEKPKDKPDDDSNNDKDKPEAPASAGKEEPGIDEEVNQDIPADEGDVPKEAALDDILAENKLLQERIDALDMDVSNLKYQVYTLLQEKQKYLSDITVDNIRDKVRSVIDGVMRKHTGKVN